MMTDTARWALPLLLETILQKVATDRMTLSEGHRYLAPSFDGDICRALLIARNASAHAPVRMNRVHLATLTARQTGQTFKVYTPAPSKVDVMEVRS